MNSKILGCFILSFPLVGLADIPAASDYRELQGNEVSAYLSFEYGRVESGQELLIRLNTENIMCPSGTLAGTLAVGNEESNYIVATNFQELSLEQAVKLSMYIYATKEIYQVTLSYFLSGCGQDTHENVRYKFK